MAARAQYGKQRQALPQHRRQLRLQKSARKTHKTRIFPLKQRPEDHSQQFNVKIKRSQSKNRQEKRSDESPWHPSQGSAAI